ncbi:MAG TPA: hypothetical protein DEQ09_04215 [Bacteroidales bacterium]|nr:hypothetical protein [Bacteroidales bacterium]
MKLLLKILKYIISVIISVIVVLYIFSVLFEKNISVVFVKELNKKLTTEITASEINFSLLKRFPHASIELTNTYVSSPDVTGTTGLNDYPDTLLYAGEVILTLKIYELIKKNFLIDRIDIDRGNINICKGLSGIYNTNILKETETYDTSSMNLNINNVNIYNSSFTYNIKTTGLYIRGRINNSSNKIDAGKLSVGFKTRASMDLSEFKAGSGYHLIGSYPVRINTGIMISGDSILIDNSDIEINGVGISGNCNILTSSHQLSLMLSTHNASSNALTQILPVGVNNLTERYGLKGLVSSSLVLNGKYDKSSPLLMNASLVFEQASIIIPRTDISIDKISTNAVLKIAFREGNDILEARADSFNALIDGSGISGSFFYRKEYNPYIDLIITGLLPSGSITRLMNIEGLNSKEGTVRLNARFWGSSHQESQNADLNIMGINRYINMGLNSVKLSLPGIKKEIDDIHGNIMVADNIWIDDLSMKYNYQNIALNGMISGFNSWLLKKDPWLDITAGLWSDRIDVNQFRNELTFKKNAGSGRDTKLNLNLSLICDSIILGNFSASLFEGTMSYLPGLVDISSFSMHSLGGSLSGNAAAALVGDEGYEFRGWFDVNNIDISNTFSVFNNFRQDYIQSENLEGLLTGNISISARADKEFKINKKDLTVSGDYSILNGQLVDFEPAYKLSNFVEIEELKNISFSKLENELIIINEMITIPRMDISSSVFNISLEGNHSFIGEYDYHIKVLLSELLSKRENPSVSEFGIIEDDGLGRTSLYLRLSGDKQGSRVSHDTQALRAGIKEDLIQEKQALKSIFREEYGWYKGDSLPGAGADKTRKFRIVWEETDSIRTEGDKSVEKKLPLIRLFRKKNIKKEESEKK